MSETNPSYRHRIRRRARLGAFRSMRLAAAAVCLLAPALAGCQQLTEAELRSILASGTTSTVVTALNTSFTSIIGAAISNAFGDIMKAFYGVP